ncbi:MAG: hypothetical protein ACO2PO_20270 [Candidatus Calescibacterium sp.]
MRVKRPINVESREDSEKEVNIGTTEYEAFEGFERIKESFENDKDFLKRKIKEFFEGDEQKQLLEAVEKAKTFDELKSIEGAVMEKIREKEWEIIKEGKRSLKKQIESLYSEGILTAKERDDLLRRVKNSYTLDELRVIYEEIYAKLGEEEQGITGRRETTKGEKSKTETKRKEAPVERKKGAERIKEGIGKSEEIFGTTRTSFQKEKLIFDARPHITLFSIASRDPKVKSLRALVVEDWVNIGDIERRGVPHLILGGSDEVENFFRIFKKGDFVNLIEYEVIIDDQNRRLILRVPEDYFKFEEQLTRKLKEIYGIYGENELKRFLRAGLITEIIEDRNFNFEKIRESHGNYRISLEIGDLIREDTEWKLNKFVRKGFSPDINKTFTSLLKVEELDKYIEGWEIRRGYLLPFLRDESDLYLTIDGILERNIEIGKAFERGDVKKFPFGKRPEYGKLVEMGKVKESWRIIRQIVFDTLNSGRPDWLKHFSNLVEFFPGIIWDYVSRYEPRKSGGSELIHFLSFITSPEEKYKINMGGKKVNYWEGYEIIAKEKGIDLSKATFPEKVVFFLNDYVSMSQAREGKTFEVDINKLAEQISDKRIQEGYRTLAEFANDMVKIDREIKDRVEGILKGIESYNEALRELKRKFEEVAKKWRLRANVEGIEGFFKEVTKIVEEYVKQTGKMPEDFWEEVNKVAETILTSRRRETSIVPFRKGVIVPLEQELEAQGIWGRILENAKAKGLFAGEKIENLINNEMGMVGDLIGEEAGRLLRAPFFKTTYLKRLARYGGLVGGIMGIGYGIYHLFFKDKKEKEEPKSPIAVVEEEAGGKVVATQTEEFRPIYLFPNLWNEYKAARESYKQAVHSYTRGILNFILMSSIFANEIPDIPASDLIRLKVLAEWEGKDFTKLAQGYVVAKRRGITPKTLEELEYYAGVEEPERMKLEKIASMLEKVYNMNVKMNERLLMQAYDRYKMFMRANIDIIKSQFREWQKRQTLIEKAKLSQQSIAKELGLLLAIEAYKKEKEKEKEGEKIAEAGR